MSSPVHAKDGQQDRASCPSWCKTQDHNFDAKSEGREHRRAVGEFWQREHRTGAGRTTRPAGGRVSVSISTREDSDGAFDEELVEIDLVTRGGEQQLALTVGEALRLVAMVEAAASLLDQFPA